MEQHTELIDVAQLKRRWIRRFVGWDEEVLDDRVSRGENKLRNAWSTMDARSQRYSKRVLWEELSSSSGSR